MVWRPPPIGRSAPVTPVGDRPPPARHRVYFLHCLPRARPAWAGNHGKARQQQAHSIIGQNTIIIITIVVIVTIIIIITIIIIAMIVQRT